MNKVGKMFSCCRSLSLSLVASDLVRPTQKAPIHVCLENESADINKDALLALTNNSYDSRTACGVDAFGCCSWWIDEVIF